MSEYPKVIDTGGIRVTVHSAKEEARWLAPVTTSAPVQTVTVVEDAPVVEPDPTVVNKIGRKKK